MTLRQALPAYLLVAAGAVSGFFVLNQLQDDRAYDQCVTRAEGRASVRAAFLDLYQLLDDTGDQAIVAFVITARARLDERQPPLDAAEC